MYNVIRVSVPSKGEGVSISIARDSLLIKSFCSWFLGEMTADEAISFMKERLEIMTFAVYKNLDRQQYILFASKSIDTTIEMREINSCDSKYGISGEVTV